MAYASASPGGYGGGPTVIHTDASHADAVSISDAELLFTGHLERKGPDLFLTGHDGHRHIIPDYFAAEHHADFGGAERCAHHRRSGRSARRLAGARTVRASTSDGADRRDRPDRESRRRCHGDAQRRIRGAACRRRGLQERRRADRGRFLGRHRLSRRHRAQSRLQHPDGAERLRLRSERNLERRAVQPGPGRLCLRRRQGRPYRRHEDRDAGRDHGHPRHHRLCAGAGRHRQRQRRQCDDVVCGGGGPWR